VNAVKRTDYALEVAAAYAFNRQCNLTISVPFSDQTFSRRTPFPIGPYDTTHTRGIGDVTLTGRYWLFNCDRHAKGNVSLGLGVKFPTGDSDARDRYRNAAGLDPQVKPVSGSIQPGQGGIGVLFDFQAFRDLGSGTVFASGSYLANPRNTTHTLSYAVGLNGIENVPANARYNSVPDLYVARVGAAVPIRRLRGVALSLSGRLEGSPRHDLIGKSDGWRLAGYGVFIEPGISYSRGSDTWALSVPVRVHQYQQQAPGVVRETFADEILLFSYSTRFGGRAVAPRPARLPNSSGTVGAPPRSPQAPQ
jgi:hypothetical protein